MRALFCVLALASTVCAADNLIANGDFQSTEKATGGAFHGWTAGDPAHIVLATEGDNAFARNATGKHVNTSQTIQIKPEWKAFEVSARIRVKNLVRTGDQIWQVPTLQFLTKNEKGEVVGDPKWTKFMITADQDWTALKATKQISAEAKNLVVSIETFGAQGTFDFDDIVVTPVLK